LRTDEILENQPHVFYRWWSDVWNAVGRRVFLLRLLLEWRLRRYERGLWEWDVLFDWDWERRKWRFSASANRSVGSASRNARIWVHGNGGNDRSFTDYIKE
jgi:hypothetical protein